MPLVDGFLHTFFVLINIVTCRLDSSPEYAYLKSPVLNEYILQYNGYYTVIFRQQIIKEIASTTNTTMFEIEQKNEALRGLTSDFDVIKIYSKTDSFISAKHVFLKNISRQTKITRSLLKIKSEPDHNVNELVKSNSRKLFRAVPKQLVDQVNAKFMWNKGVTGRGVKVAVFDTGLENNHPHFKNVIERIDWTDGNDPNDNLGHGTFVCGLIASSKECLGLAPDAFLFIFKVFTDSQVSYTSWFLDAFNYAIQKKIDVLNLSIGGPDFMDIPFIEKVWQITSNNIVMVSGIGNDGPLYGTLNNPADQLDVIGVGGINTEDQIAKFSSRGMTTWELPSGYGRVKPDIVTYCTHVRGSRKNGGCRTLSGTSVASPIITGAVALLLSAAKKFEFTYKPNPGIIKQIIMGSADRLDAVNMFEQGIGKLNLQTAFKVMRSYTPQASMVPSYIDLTECPYFWPYCTQPLYYTAMPVVVNVTILNGMDVTGFIKNRPVWKPSSEENGSFLKLSFEYSRRLWPWSGYLAISFTVTSEAYDFNGVAEGLIEFEVVSEPDKVSKLSMFVRARIIAKPTRKQRILWDQFHNLRYPSGYFPRDDLQIKNEPLDWNADHPHTNFKDMYQYLRSAGYFVETLGKSYNCFDPLNYGTLLIVDTEEEFHQTEIKKLYESVTSKGLSLIVFADWYNSSVITNAKFYDENTRKWWIPVTGGANIPALNDLLKPFGIAFGDKVYEGEFSIGEHSAIYASGTSIIKFPSSNKSFLVLKKLNDQGREFLLDAANISHPFFEKELVPILGLYQIPIENFKNPGRIAVFGDSNCLDSAHSISSCFWLLSALLEFTMHSNVYKNFKETNPEVSEKQLVDEPNNIKRLDAERFSQYSKITNPKLVQNSIRCEKFKYELESPIDNIPSEIFPNKNNYFNFFKLNSNIEYNDALMKINEDYVEEEPLILEENSVSPGYRTSLLQGINESNYPVFSSLALIFVLCYILVKIWKYRNRITRFNNFKQTNRRD